MYYSAVAAFGAMAYTIGKFGAGSLVSLGKLFSLTLLAMAVFVIVVQGIVAKYYGFSIIKFIGYIRDEIFLVLGTSSVWKTKPYFLDFLLYHGQGPAQYRAGPLFRLTQSLSFSRPPFQPVS
jgi:aerobic C4-dicarboxylate transport protein